jgi:hypothetical protein
VKYLTKGQLLSLNNKAIDAQQENFISRGSIRILPKEAKFPVVEATPLDGYMAIEVGLNPFGLTGIIDVSTEDYQDLPDFEVDQEVYQALEQMLEDGQPNYH